MEQRKNPKKDLRSKSGLFFQIGLLVAMGLVVSAFEFRAFDDYEPLSADNFGVVEDELIPITEIKPPPPPPPKVVIKNPRLVEVDDPTVDIPEVEIVIDPIDILTIPEPEIEEDESIPDEPFVIVEKMPEPEGGIDAFYKFINKKLRYPKQAKRMGIEGTVFLEFVVDENGDMTQIKIAKGIGVGCDKEVLRVFENPPKWKPGKQRGVPVKVRKIIPIKFTLN